MGTVAWNGYLIWDGCIKNRCYMYRDEDYLRTTSLRISQTQIFNLYEKREGNLQIERHKLSKLLVDGRNNPPSLSDSLSGEGGLKIRREWCKTSAASIRPLKLNLRRLKFIEKGCLIYGGFPAVLRVSLRVRGPGTIVPHVVDQTDTEVCGGILLSGTALLAFRNATYLGTFSTSASVSGE